MNLHIQFNKEDVGRVSSRTDRISAISNKNLITILIIFLLVIGRYFNAEFSHPDNGTRLLALLATSLGLALVARDNGDPSELVLLRLLLLFLRTH